jgi:hypothetical protein
LAGAALAVLLGTALVAVRLVVVAAGDGADRPVEVVRPALVVAGVLVAAMTYRPLLG